MPPPPQPTRSGRPRWEPCSLGSALSSVDAAGEEPVSLRQNVKSKVQNLSLEHLRHLAGWVLGIALSTLAGSVLALALVRRGRARSVPWVLAASMVPCLGCMHRCFRPFENDISSYRLATLINGHWKPGDLIVVDGLYETYNSLSFYTRRPLHILNGRQGYLEYGSRYPDAPPLFLDRAAFERLIHRHGAGRVFLVTRQPQRFPIPDGHPHLLREQAGRSLLLFGGS